MADRQGQFKSSHTRRLKGDEVKTPPEKKKRAQPFQLKALSPNAIDLTTLEAVLEYLNTNDEPASAGDADNIQLCITSWSMYWLQQTGKGNMDGSLPSASPFVEPVAYDEYYDGQGNYRQGTRNDPIISVELVQVGLLQIPQSTNLGVPGWVIDGSGKFIALRNAGGGNPGAPLTVGFASVPGAGGYRFWPGIQNVHLQYHAGFSGVMPDIEEKSIKAVATNYKRKGWLDQASQSFAASQTTVRYRDWHLSPDIREVLRNYMRKKLV